MADALPTLNRRAPGFFSFAECIPTAKLSSLSFRERLLCWANGINKADVPACVFPYLIIFFYAAKMALYVLLFTALVQDKSQSVWSDLYAAPCTARACDS